MTAGERMQFSNKKRMMKPWLMVDGSELRRENHRLDVKENMLI